MKNEGWRRWSFLKELYESEGILKVSLRILKDL